MEAATPAKKKTAVRVSTMNGIETRRRAGFVFSPKPITISVTPEQEKVLRADASLSVLSVGGPDLKISDELANALTEADRWKGEAVRLRRNLNAAIEQLTAAGAEFAPPPDDDGGELLDFPPPREPEATDGIAPARGERQPRPGGARAGGVRAGQIPLDDGGKG